MTETSTQFATSEGDRQGAPASSIARRALFAGAALLAVAPATAATAAGGVPDAELIAQCHRFAERFLATWYQVY